MARKIGAVIALDGEQQFKQAVSACTRSLNTMKSELKYVEAQAGTQGKTLEGLKGKHEVLNKVLDASKQKEEAIGKGLEHAKTDYENTGKQLDSYKDQLKLAQEKLDKMKSSADTTDEELKEQQEVVKGLTEIVGQGEKAYEKAGIRVDDWQKKLYDAKTETAKAEQAVDENKKAMEELETATDKAGGEIKEFGDEAHNAADKTGELDISLASMVKNAAVNLAVDAMKSIGSKAGEAAKYVLDVGTQFEASMSKVSAVSGATGGDLEKLSQKAQEMGSTTKFSASEAATAMNYMAMAGWKTQDMLSGIEGIMNLAAASGEDLATTSDIVTDALTAFGLKAQDSGHFADVLASASSNANTNVSMLGESFKYAAPVAGALGASAEDTTIALGLMANAGIKASQAGTALRTGLTNLAKPTKQMQIAMDEYGVALVENNDGSINLRDTMTSLREKMGGLSESEQAAAAAAIFGKNAMSGWLAVINASDEDFDKLVTSIDNCDGTAKSMAETMQNNLPGAITIFKSATEGLGIAIYEKVAAPLTDAVEFATGVISDLTGAVSGEKTTLETFLDDVSKSNEQVERTLKNAQTTVSNAESKVAELDTYKTSFDEILDQCDDFNKVTLETGKTAIVDASGNIVEKLGDVGDEAVQLEKNLTEWNPNGINTSGVSTSADELRSMIGYVKTDVDGMGDSIKKTYVITDEFTKAKINAMIDAMGDSVGDLADAWNEQTGELKASKKELDKWFDTAKDIAMYTALQDALADVNKAYGEAAVNVAMAESGYKAAKKELDDFIASSGKSVEELEKEANSYNALGQITSQTGAKYRELSDAVVAAQEQVDETNKTLDTATQVLDDTNAALEPLKESYENAQTAADDAAESNGGVSRSLDGVVKDSGKAVKSTEDVVEALKDEQKAARELQEAMQEAKDNITDAFSEMKESAENSFSVNPFGKWEVDVEKSIQSLKDSMKQQADGLLAYKDNITVVKDHLGKTAPEFVQYLEDMGTSGVYVVEQLATSFRNGDTSAADELMAAYKESVNIQEDLTNTLAADALALKMGLGELGSTAAEWSDLELAFDECKAQIRAGGEEVSKETYTSFRFVVDAAKEMGIKIPDGLAESIRDSDNPTLALQQATDTLNSAMQGQALGLLEVAKQTGASIPDGVEEAITSGEGDVAAAYSQLANALSGKDVEFEDAGKQSGQKMSTGTASGITERQSDVTKSTEQVVDAAKTAATTATTTFKIVGSSAMEALKMGMSEQSQSVSAKVKAIITIVKNNAATHGDPLFNTAGADMISKYIEGMNSKSSDAAGKAKSIVENAQKTAKSHGDGTFKTAGSSAITNYISGMTTKAKDVEGKAKSIVSAAKTAADTAGKALQTAGQTAISNYINGMNSKSGDASAKAKSIGTASSGAIDGVRNAFTTAGSNAIENYKNGMNSKAGEAGGKAQEIANTVLNNLNKSSDAYNRGHSLATEFGNGIFWGSGTAYVNATNLANNAVSNTKRDSDAWWSGYNMAMGFAEGISKGVPWVESTARTMAAAAVAAANKELGVESPSKVFRKIGDFTAQGFALGIKDGRSDVEDAVSETLDLGSTAVDALGGLDIAGGTISLDATTHGANDRLDALIAIVNAYMPQILEANQSGKVFDLSGNFMGNLALQTSERIGQNVRRSR